jgi:predicted AlkP superfamily phosphohydrolase/phosphomutase
VGDYYLAVNSTDWKGGIVPANQKEAVLRQATTALLAALDAETGEQIVTRVFRPTDVMGIGMAGETAPDLYLDFADGYVPKNSIDQSGIVRRLPLSIGSGDHGFFPQRMSMQTIWFATGPGIAAGKKIGLIRQIDIAPTLSRAFGIPAPANAVGHVIGEALVAP